MSSARSEGKLNERTAWHARGAGWDRAAAPGRSVADDNNQLLIEAAAIGPGQAVVDLASGAGEPAISIALAVGPQGRVVATDFAASMLAGARRRAARLALAHLSFAVVDMVALPYEAGIFDALTCRFGIMFPSDSVAVLGEARRVLRPGARAAYLVHGPHAENEAFAAMWAAVAAFRGKPDRSAETPRYRFAQPGALAAAMSAAGFADVEERELRRRTTRPARADVWLPDLQRAHADLLDELDEAGRAALERALAAAFERYREGDTYRLMSHVRLGVGTA
jgi:SAM-dependent methyltransferase